MQVYEQNKEGWIADIASDDLYQSRPRNTSSALTVDQEDNHFFLERLKGVSSAQFGTGTDTAPLCFTMPGKVTGDSFSPSSSSRQGLAKQRIEFFKTITNERQYP